MKEKTTIKGKTIRLRPLEERDLKKRVGWFNKPDIYKNLILNEKLNLEQTIQWFKRSKKDENRQDFVIETLQGYPIGSVGFRKINKEDCSACYYIVIGEKKYWKKGVGTEASKILLQRGFGKLGLKKIWSTVRASNKASLGLLKKLGFKKQKPKTQLNQADADLVNLSSSKNDFKNAVKQL